MLTMNNYEDMIALWTRAGLPCKPKGRDSKRAMASQMESNPSLFLGAFNGNTLVGAVIGSYDQRRKGWINRLAVNPEYQRQGIGRLLITSMEKVLKEKGVSLVCALIEEGSNESMRLFEKLGYVYEKSILYFSKRESKDV